MAFPAARTASAPRQPAAGPGTTSDRLRATGGVLVMVLALASRLDAAPAPRANHDESKVPPYVLPDLLRTAAGEPVVTSNAWFQTRRPELFELLSREVYGRTLPAPTGVRWTVLKEDRQALGGRAVRREVALDLTQPQAGRALRFTVLVPARAPGPVPVFAGLHLFDTSKPHPETAVPRRPGPGATPEALPSAPETSPGQVGRETTDWILARGYALVSLDLPELAPDSGSDWRRGVVRLLGGPEEGPPGADETGALGIWAWGLSRVLDYAATTEDLDASRVIAVGHSRMGKAALWAGACDPRFAAVISNDSGCGGAALSKRLFGETVGIITRAFPHWFAGNFSRYAGREEDLPVDQHALLALIAPRPLFVASAEADAWADPRGEFLSAWHASSVYRLLGRTALDPSSSNLPPADLPFGGTLRYHLRRGQHDLTDVDWVRYLEFADDQVARARPQPARAPATPGRPDWKRWQRQPDSWFASEEGRRITRQVLAWQTPLGDWPKNLDTTAPTPTPGADAKAPGAGAPRGTFDNGATVHELRFLARAARVTADPGVVRAVERGTQHVLDAQLPSGGWPQSHPPGGGYARHITFNDRTLVNVLELVRDIAHAPDFAGLAEPLRRRAGTAFDRGIDCILRCQVTSRGRLTVWGAQHDAETLLPAPARTFEPASLAAAESAGVLHLLMSLENPSPRVIAAVRAGAAWFGEVRIHGLRQERINGDKRVVQDPGAPPMWARFYELETFRPLFCGRDGVVKYQLSEIEAERRNGYAWYGDWGEGVAREFARWSSRPGASAR